MDIDETPKIEWPDITGVSVLARSYPRGTHLGLHMHREAQLVFAAEGVMQVTTPAGRWLVPPQRAVWVPPRQAHAIDALSHIELRTLYVDPAWLKVHVDDPRLEHEFVIEVRRLLREVMLALFDTGNPNQRIGLLVRLALLELIEAADAATFMPMPSDARVRRVAELVLSKPAAEHRLEVLARLAGTSPRTLTRLFPAETRLTLKEWRQRARIMAAIELLGAGSPSVKSVAARLGFASAAAFTHAFRQVLGATPSEFITRRRDT